MIGTGLIALVLLAVVAQSQTGRRSLAARVTRRFSNGGRSWRTVGWAAGTAVTYGVTAIAALLLIGRVSAAATLPPEFAGLAARWGMPATVGSDTAQIAWSLLLGAAIGTGLLFLARWVRSRSGRPLRSRTLYRSPASAQDRQEVPAALLLALSAGVSEELFFRLALPLALALATGSVLAGIAIATATFGLAHRYQGAIGVVLTTLVGAALVWLHLWTGALWFVMLVHVVVDVHALVVRPWIMGWQ